jgi:hypothetical protein
MMMIDNNSKNNISIHKNNNSSSSSSSKTSTRLYYYVILLSLLSFGSNFSHSSILIFNLYFLNDHFIQPFGMGLILSSLSLPHLFLPLFVGYLIDQKGNIQLFTLLLLFLVIIGFVFYMITSSCKIFILLLLSLIIYSCGSSSITTIQRILLTIYTKVLL